MFFTKSTDIARQLKFEILSFAEAEAASFYRLPKLEHKDPLRSAHRPAGHTLQFDAHLERFKTERLPNRGAKILW